MSLNDWVVRRNHGVEPFDPISLPQLDVPLIAVAGTNGKSSCAAMIEAIADAAGFRVGLLLSSHLVRWEERCRHRGREVAFQELQPALFGVEHDYGDRPASWLVMLAMLRHLAMQPLDLLIVEVEAGPGDALVQLKPDVLVLTSVAVDPVHSHASTREARAGEWRRLIERCGTLVMADPVPPEPLDSESGILLAMRDFHFGGDRQQWSWSRAGKRYNALAYPALRGANQLLNAAGALAALDVLSGVLPVSAQAVRNGLALVSLPGRFQIMPGEPTIVLDIAGNAHAVAALGQNLDQMAFYPRTHAVFGADVRSDVDSMLTRMAPIVDTWCFCDSLHGYAAHQLRERHAALGLPGPGPVSVACFDSPHAALGAMVQRADPTDRIAVFGSNAVVGAVLASGMPRTFARHTGDRSN